MAGGKHAPKGKVNHLVIDLEMKIRMILKHEGE
jgi:hypothetical protein